MDYTHELTLAEAAKRLPRRNGKSVHVNTLRRWIALGCKGIKLNAWRRGGIWYTSESAVTEFTRECTLAANGVPVPTPADVAAEIEWARKKLRRSGFYGQNNKRKGVR